MPIYEYTCGSCDLNFEELVPLGGSTSCPRCGESDPSRRFGSFGIASNTARTPLGSAAHDPSASEPAPPGGYGEIDIQDCVNITIHSGSIARRNGGTGIRVDNSHGVHFGQVKARGYRTGLDVTDSSVSYGEMDIE